MCGRYSFALRPWQVRAYLEGEDMPVYDAPDDEDDHGPRQSYNFAPGYNGLVYRADTPDWGAGPRSHKKGEGSAEAEPENEAEKQTDSTGETDSQDTRYKLQSMKWGLIPFWTKRNPDYASMLKTINCRDDSLIENRGMWTTMKQKKRCIVLAQGFYEWLKKNGGKEKIPHYIKRKDGKLMCMAGLWDCVQYEGTEDKLYSYTIITTSSNKQLDFLHDRMPVILENGSEDIRKWLDPKTYTWTRELQSLLKPYKGELEIYPVSKDVGKVGNNSPTFIIPISSAENKNNIANFFTSPKGSKASTASKGDAIKYEKADDTKIKHDPGEDRKTLNHTGTEDNAPLPVPDTDRVTKRTHVDDVPDEEPPTKTVKKSSSVSEKLRIPPPVKSISPVKGRKTRSATSNGTGPPKVMTREKGSRKITSFFKK